MSRKATICQRNQARHTIINLSICTCLLIFITGCIGAGTHGSIKCYEYPVSKQVLQKAVEKVITEDGNIHRDTVAHYTIDETNGRNDTVWDNYYNDTENYVTIYIQQQDGTNQYIFQYGGGKEDWDTSKISYVSIAYAYNKDGRGGSFFAVEGQLTHSLEVEVHR